MQLPSLKFKLRFAAQGLFFDEKRNVRFAVPPGKVKPSSSFLKCFGRCCKKKRCLVRKNITNESARYGKAREGRQWNKQNLKAALT